MLFHVHVFVETRLPWDSAGVWEADGDSGRSGSCGSNRIGKADGSSRDEIGKDDDASLSAAVQPAVAVAGDELAAPPPPPPLALPQEPPVLLPPFVPRDGYEYFPPHTMVYQQR